jgi:uncharacterized integral membrane protein (TIGR00698 family)
MKARIPPVRVAGSFRNAVQRDTGKVNLCQPMAKHNNVPAKKFVNASAVSTSFKPRTVISLPSRDKIRGQTRPTSQQTLTTPRLVAQIARDLKNDKPIQPGLKSHALNYLPGLGLVLSITALAYVVQFAEIRLIGHSMIEALVVALLVGILWRNTIGLSSRNILGVRFAGKQMLELAIVLLGASLDLSLVTAAGPSIIVAAVLTVCLSLTVTFAIGRLIGLNRRLATLIAVGNSICGNSAIAAVAPVIGAETDDIASSIALTAVVGVVMVLCLPVLVGALHLGLYQYGVLAGLTVYAVPQVMAATFPLGVLSVQVGTLVKLLRVLLLGPVILLLVMLGRKKLDAPPRLYWLRIVPWFIGGFMIMAGLRSEGIIPSAAVDGLRQISLALTVVAMAALGLEANLQAIRKVGARVMITVTLSLLALIVISATLIRLLHIG